MMPCPTCRLSTLPWPMERNTICQWYDHDEEDAARLCLVPTPTDWFMLKTYGKVFSVEQYAHPWWPLPAGEGP